MLILQSIIGGNFNLIVPVLSTIINPGNSDYKQVYL